MGYNLVMDDGSADISVTCGLFPPYESDVLKEDSQLASYRSLQIGQPDAAETAGAIQSE